MRAVRTRRLPPWAIGVLGTAGAIALWWILAVTVFSQVGAGGHGTGGAIPTPWGVLVQALHDGIGFYWPNASITLTEAGMGFLGGNILALLLSAVVLILPSAENLITQIAVISYCIPIVAIGPIIGLVVGSPLPGDPSTTAAALAGLSVFFTTVVGTLYGLRSADRSSLDIVTVYGGGRIKRLLKVQLISALPSILTALRVAAPAAFLGAILGEYIGGVDVGFGPAMVNAQQSLEIERVWGVAIVSGLLAGAGYAIIGLVARFVTPWSSGREGDAS
jgi:ABC-type nitrate/sulfonate/bicarbonate transport system permease component